MGIEAVNKKIELKEIRIKFNAAWTKLLKDISKDTNLLNIPETVIWLETLMKQNVPKGKQNRGLVLITLYSQLKGMTTEDEELSYILGWCCEIGQAGALIVDDIMDGSETRRGEICWYKEPEVGLSAVNDAFLLENITYFIYYKYFSEKKYFSKLLKTIHDISLKTIMGQSMDTRLAINFTMDECTLDKYERIVKYKTSYYSFYQPCVLSMIAADINDDSLFNIVEAISLEMGYLFQVQDDYLDCYGNTHLTGKIGTDIIDKKCTWLLVTALEHATEKQKEILNISYGSKLQNDEDIVRQIYKEVNIEKLFRKFEKKTYRQIGDMIYKFPSKIPQAPFLILLNAMYRRNK